ncbi:HAD hydrolase-like protein [Labilibaculum sp.]|uniref:HAD family hydrolase n=1 Tax=Labilibaculum sp. TaxID=2060723 RepID=UPI002AA7BFAE|nr:HAD hydrolase-like protein [Labilibaculum sp.]MBN2596692.1 HAD family hydrolase [Marinifilaceae bacterium]
MIKSKAIIWDYNGTLLDDLSIGLKSINQMLIKRKLPVLSQESYRDVFTFPVKKYYESVGFDFEKEDWDCTAKEFISNYKSLLPESSIFPEAIQLLSHFSSLGKKQFILSAMEQNMLNASVANENISNFFSEISGIDNIYASSKIKNGIKMIENHQLSAKDVCLLGDTTHDYEVAQELGCNCILIAAGHQSITKLKQTGCPIVVNHLNDIIKN